MRIGLVTEDLSTNAFPGHSKNTVGYSCGNGGIYHGQEYVAMFICDALKYSKDEVGGCYLDPLKRIIRFTKNEKFNGLVIKDISIEKSLFLAVGLYYPNSSGLINFGGQPFVFKLEGTITTVNSLGVKT